MTNPTKRQMFQSVMQVVIIFAQGLLTALFAIGGFPSDVQLYMAVIGSMGMALASAAAIFGISQAQVGGIANESKIVRALHSNHETGELLAGTTARELARPAPELLK